MNNLKEMSAAMLCKFGRFGLGKSLTLGMYDFEVPQKLAEYHTKSDSMKVAGSKTNKL